MIQVTQEARLSLQSFQPTLDILLNLLLDLLLDLLSDLLLDLLLKFAGAQLHRLLLVNSHAR